MESVTVIGAQEVTISFKRTKDSSKETPTDLMNLKSGSDGVIFTEFSPAELIYALYIHVLDGPEELDPYPVTFSVKACFSSKGILYIIITKRTINILIYF